MFTDEKYDIQPSTPGITATDGAGASWNADNWDLKPGANISYRLGSWSSFSAYLVGDDAAEMPAATKLRILKRGVGNDEHKLIWQGTYELVKEMRDRNKIMYLGISREIEVGPSEHLVIQANGADAAGTGDLDVSASHFKLKSMRRRKALD